MTVLVCDHFSPSTNSRQNIVTSFYQDIKFYTELTSQCTGEK